MNWFNLTFILPATRALVLFILFLTSGSGTAVDIPSACEKDFAARVARGEVTSYEIEVYLKDHTADRLIVFLEKHHLVHLRNGGIRSSLGWQSFYPSWIFDDSSVLEEVLEYFDPVDSSARPQYLLGYVKWLEQWETLYSAKIGPLALRWSEAKGKGRKRFLQKLLTHAAVRHALRMRLTGANTFIRFESHQTLVVNQIGTGIRDVYAKEIGKFRREFDRLFKRSMKAQNLSVANPSLKSSDTAAKVRRQLRNAGGNIQGSSSPWTPALDLNDQDRAKKQFLRDAVEAIRTSSNPLFSYEKLLIQFSGDDEGSSAVNMFPGAVEIERLFGSLSSYLREVNRSLLEQKLAEVVPQLGASSLMEEFTVQLAALSLRDNFEFTAESFGGFQLEDPEVPGYIQLNNPLFEIWKNRLQRLTDLVRRRL